MDPELIGARAFAPEDAAPVSRLSARCLPPGWSAAALCDEAARGGTVVVVDGRRGVVGYAIVRTVLDEGELLAIGVDPDERGRGHGGALLGAVVDAVAARGVRTLHLEVAEANAPALRLYRAHGFETVGRRARYYRDGRAAVLMARSVR